MDTLLVDVLFQYDAWANRLVLQTCCLLSQEQFEQPIGLGLGNLERTCAHLVGSLIFFADRLNHVPPRPRPDREHRTKTADELLHLFESANQDLLAAVARCVEIHSLTDFLVWRNDDSGDIDPLDRIPYAIALAQMIDHSIHHRTQIMDMLRLLGIETPMDWHPFEWDEVMRS